LPDRSSRPRGRPRQPSLAVRSEITDLRREQRTGPFIVRHPAMLGLTSADGIDRGRDRRIRGKSDRRLCNPPWSYTLDRLLLQEDPEPFGAFHHGDVPLYPQTAPASTPDSVERARRAIGAPRGLVRHDRPVSEPARARTERDDTGCGGLAARAVEFAVAAVAGGHARSTARPPRADRGRHGRGRGHARGSRRRHREPAHPWLSQRSRCQGEMVRRARHDRRVPRPQCEALGSHLLRDELRIAGRRRVSRIRAHTAVETRSSLARFRSRSRPVRARLHARDVSPFSVRKPATCLHSATRTCPVRR